jgi:hypothetical protein
LAWPKKSGRGFCAVKAGLLDQLSASPVVSRKFKLNKISASENRTISFNDYAGLNCFSV